MPQSIFQHTGGEGRRCIELWGVTVAWPTNNNPNQHRVVAPLGQPVFSPLHQQRFEVPAGDYELRIADINWQLMR